MLFIIYDTHFWGWSRVTPLYTKKRKEKKASTETKKKVKEYVELLWLKCEALFMNWKFRGC